MRTGRELTRVSVEEPPLQEITVGALRRLASETSRARDASAADGTREPSVTDVDDAVARHLHEQPPVAPPPAGDPAGGGPPSPTTARHGAARVRLGHLRTQPGSTP